VIPAGALAALALALVAQEGHESNAGNLPVCSNGVINRVVKRVGCTLGDTRCWSRSGGYCGDHVEARIAAMRPGAKLRLAAIRPEEVRKGDVAVFSSRAHYAVVEEVVRDKGGRPMAVDLSELNFGTCWVDEGLLITDQFKLVGRRAGVAVQAVDGGFLRAGPVAL
jgi:hypothetical protein